MWQFWQAALYDRQAETDPYHVDWPFAPGSYDTNCGIGVHGARPAPVLLEVSR